MSLLFSEKFLRWRPRTPTMATRISSNNQIIPQPGSQAQEWRPGRPAANRLNPGLRKPHVACFLLGSSLSCMLVLLSQLEETCRGTGGLKKADPYHQSCQRSQLIPIQWFSKWVPQKHSIWKEELTLSRTYLTFHVSGQRQL